MAALLCATASGVQAQALPRVRATPAPEPPREQVGSDVAPPLITLTADDVVSHIGGVTQASGKVVVHRLDTDVHADLLTYDTLSDTVHAEGKVRILRGLDWFSADRLDLELTRSAGTLIGTEYELGERKAGGRAQRIELQDREHSSAFMADYTSCPRDMPEPDWIITGDRIDIDTSTNEGKATHAKLRFLGVTILAAPSLTFPVTPDRKSGWLPPTLDYSTRNGFTFGAPYYWNIEPNLDATLTPAVITNRGAALTSELRYLGAGDVGQLTVFSLPYDGVTGKSRDSIQWGHEGTRSDWLTYSARVQRVSDSLYWKDFTNQMPALTPRLLPTELSGTRRFQPFGDSGEIDAYAGMQRYQTLQDPGETDSAAIITVPYQRSAQLGLRGNVSLADQLRLDFQAEANRFDLSNKSQENSYIDYINQVRDEQGSSLADVASDQRVGGSRLHVIGSLSRNFSSDWARFEPRISINGASYHTDLMADSTASDGTFVPGSRIDATRWIPTFSADSAFSFERQASLLNRDLVQTLEPRFLYVLTPYRRQSVTTPYGTQVDLPMYDTAAKDFNEVSIFSDNQFTGIDRISDANQLTAGVTTRYNDAATGRELLRLGVAQRVLFKDQRITSDGTVDSRKLSHLLLYGSSSAMEHWSFDGTVEVDPASDWTQRAVVSTRYHPGPFKTLSLTYRYARASSEQWELGGQWPVYHQPPRQNGCSGTLYAVGRLDYSVTDSRATYAVGGFEYDAGWWMGRMMMERTSTGRNESTNHLVLQLELNGLSTLGTGSLKVLKDNVPGYQPLRNDPGASAESTNSP